MDNAITMCQFLSFNIDMSPYVCYWVHFYYSLCHIKLVFINFHVV